jgi:hypothetical protein
MTGRNSQETINGKSQLNIPSAACHFDIVREVDDYWSEAEGELVNIAGIYENSMGQYIATYEALNVLAAEWGLDSKTFNDHIVRKNEPNDKLEAGNILGRRGTYRDNSDWLEAQLLSKGWLNYTPCCPGINHALDSNRLRDLRASFLESLLHRSTNPHAHVYQWAHRLQVGQLRRK